MKTNINCQKWSVYLNGELIGTIIYYPVSVKYNVQYMCGTLREGRRYYWKATIGNKPDPDLAEEEFSRRNGESAARMRYRMAEMMMAAYLNRDTVRFF